MFCYFLHLQVATRSSHGLEADVWSLGCMLYSLLAGRPPFDTDAVKSTLTKVVMADYQVRVWFIRIIIVCLIWLICKVCIYCFYLQMPPGITSEAKDLIDSLLKKNPTQRIRLREILDHPFMTKTFSKNSKVSYVSIFLELLIETKEEDACVMFIIQ